LQFSFKEKQSLFLYDEWFVSKLFNLVDVKELFENNLLQKLPTYASSPTQINQISDSHDRTCVLSFSSHQNWKMHISV